MNLNKLKRILRDVLTRSCNTEQIAYIGREADPNFNLKVISGFGEHVVIPKQVAADTVLDYFNTEYQLLNFISLLFFYEGKGISGGIVSLKEKNKLERFLNENNFYFDPNLNKFIISQEKTKNKDWGILESGQEYKLAFLSLDIVSSSELIKTNVKLDIEQTLVNFKNYTSKKIEKFNGRIWQWYGDGGLVCFLNESGVSSAIRSCIDILYCLPIFNLTLNQLRWENRISLRLSIHFGTAVYNEDVNFIDNEDIEFTRTLEHIMGVPNEVVISETAINLSDNELRKFFILYTNYKNINIYKSNFFTRGDL